MNKLVIACLYLTQIQAGYMFSGRDILQFYNVSCYFKKYFTVSVSQYHFLEDS